MGKAKLAVGALGALVFLAGCGGEKTPEKALTAVRTQAVQQYSAGGPLRYSANIVPNSQVDLTFQSSGYIASILQVKGADGRTRDVDAGDFARKGTELARVREDDYLARVNQAKGQLLAAQASAEKAKQDFERASALYESQSLTKSDYDAAKAQLDGTSAQVEAAQAQLRLAEISLGYCRLKAPIDGWVLKRGIEVGSLVGAATLGFSLVDTHLVKAVFGVPDVNVNSIRLGRSLTITTDAPPGEFAGKVTSISPQADPKSRLFDVEVTIPNPKNLLKAGIVASLSLGEARTPKPTLVVPLSAVVRMEQNASGYTVFVVEEREGKNIAHARPVVLGEAYGNQIGIDQGLAAGERVIVVGASLVHDGEQVRVIP